MVAIVQRRTRALLLDGEDLVLIKRVRPQRAAYWTTVGGGVEPGDATIEDAVRLEVSEELGGRIAIIDQVLTLTDRRPGGIGVHHFFLARLVSWDVRARHGPEFSEPGRGSYAVVRCPCMPEAIAQIDLVPHTVSEFLQRNAEELRALAHSSTAANRTGLGAAATTMPH